MKGNEPKHTESVKETKAHRKSLQLLQAKGLPKNTKQDLLLYGLFIFVLFAQTLFFYFRINEQPTTSMMFWVFFAYGLILTALVFWLLKAGRLKVETVFLICLLTVGLCYIFLFGPLKAPDEHQSHWLVSYWYSSLMLGEGTNPFYMRSCDLDFYNKWLESWNGYAGQFAEIRNDIAQPTGNTDAVVYSDSWGVSLSSHPIQMYLFQAIGITIGRLFGLNAFTTYYLGRVVVFVVYSVCIYLAVKTTPVGKSVFMVVALNPLALELCTSYSYDGPILAIAMLLLAFCFKARYAEKQQTSTLVMLAVLTILIVPCKVVYTLLVFFAMLIPNKTFPSKRFAIVFKCALLALCVLVFAASRLSTVTSIATSDVVTASGKSWTGYTLADAISDPARTIYILLNTFFMQLGGEVVMFTGVDLGSLNLTPFNATLFIVVYCLILVVAFLHTDKKHSSTTADKVVGIVVLLIASLAICASMLFGWTEVGSEVINGVQGRYFFPLVGVLIPLFMNTRFSVDFPSQKGILYMTLCFNIIYIPNIYYSIVAFV